jgi:hypothetical protein
MTDRLLTIRDLETATAPRPGLYQLRVLERSLRARIDDLDARVDALLALDGPPTTRRVADVDVLCAAIAETRELLDEARREAARHVARRRERRLRPRRWA